MTKLPATQQATPTPASIETSFNARLAISPVPRATKRRNGLTPLKQETFIQNLADSGSVTMAAKSIGTSTSAMYHLRRGEGAESFATAWEVAIEIGARRVLDTLIEHAIHGTPETIIQGGEIVAERRRFNHRAMMWIVSQRFPEQYGSATGLMEMNGMSHAMRKLKAKWEDEFKQKYDAAADLSAEARGAKKEAEREEERGELLPAMLVKIYQNKVREERNYRLAGKTTSADLTCRQLTHIELYMEFGGPGRTGDQALFRRRASRPAPVANRSGHGWRWRSKRVPSLLAIIPHPSVAWR